MRSRSQTSRPRRCWGRCCSHPRSSTRCASRSEEHTSELQSQSNLVCRLLLEKKKKYHSEMKRTQLDTTNTPTLCTESSLNTEYAASTAQLHSTLHDNSTQTWAC